MRNDFDQYREIIDSVSENAELLKVLKNSCSNFASELNREECTDPVKLQKKERYLNELKGFEKILLKVEKHQDLRKKNERKSKVHKFHDLLGYLGIQEGDFENSEVSGIAIDSRLVRQNNVFFALRGENENGEKYVEDAFKNGASFAFVSKEYPGEDPRLVRVEDTMKALKDLARAYFKSLHCKVVAITGSVGKTGTKNFVYSILSEQYRTGMSFANYNTGTGLAMSLLDLDQDVEMLVLEYGVDAFGDMDDLVSIVPPDYGIITNISESHLEKFGTKKGIFDEKIKLAKQFCKESVLIVDGESEFLNEYRSEQFRVIKVFENEASYRASIEKKEEAALLKDLELNESGTRFCLQFRSKEEAFEMKLYGRHLALDAALAILLSGEIGLSWDLAKSGLLKAKNEAMRFDVNDIDGIRIINDAYNSSFKSLKASVQTARKICKGRLFLLAGDIKELGEDEILKHAEIGRSLSEDGIDCAVFYGDLMKEAYLNYRGGDSIHFDDVDKAAVYLLQQIAKGDCLLVKASRSLQLERVSDLVTMNLIRTEFVELLLEASKEFFR